LPLPFFWVVLLAPPPTFFPFDSDGLADLAALADFLPLPLLFPLVSRAFRS